MSNECSFAYSCLAGDIFSNQHWIGLPFLSKHFQGRESLLVGIRERFLASADGQSIVILHGGAGIGKSELAISYAVRHRQQYEGVFWASALSRRSLKSDYERFKTKLQMPLASWTQAPGRRWLLIIDNLDDPNEFGQPAEWIPLNGHVLLTTRRQLPIFEKLGHLIKVDVLDPKAAIDMMLSVAAQRTRAADDRNAASAIVHVLGRLPLAIEQSGAFVSVNRDRLSDYLVPLKAILTRVEPSSSAADNTEDIENFWVGETDAARKTILTTWSMSFEKISRTNEIAAALLSVCAFLDGHGIVEDVLMRGLSNQKRFTADGNIGIKQPWGIDPLPLLDEPGGLAKAKLEKAIRLLRSYSLMFSKRPGKTYYFHPVS